MNSVLKSLFLRVFWRWILLGLLLGGCTGNPRDEQVNWDFWASGKLAVKSAQDGYSARFDWRQWGARYEIAVWGPLGQGRTELVGDGQRMAVRRGSRLLDDGSPQEVMLRHLGWTIPVAALPAWLRGEAFSDLDLSAVALDESGRVNGFQQDGWTVGFERFKQFEAGVRPERITATRGDYRVRVIVGEYRE